MLKITDGLTIDDDLLEESFVRASGPGGQNVNKVSSAVELRLAVEALEALTAGARARLRRLAGHRLTKEGVIVIRAERFRTQDMNRQDARERLVELIREALIPPKPRVKTKPTKASKERRLKAKSERSGVKKERRRTSDW